MNNVYIVDIFDTNVKFDSYMLIVQNDIMKYHFIELLSNKHSSNEYDVILHTSHCGESELNCGIYTKEGLLMYTDEANLAFEKW